MAKVLVADRELARRAELEKALREWGYDVVVAASGFQAIRELLEDPGICLAVVDRAVPGMDGLKVCRVIQGLGRTVHAILLDAELDAESRRRARAAGAAECLGLPVSLDDLRSQLEAGRRRIEPA